MQADALSEMVFGLVYEDVETRQAHGPQPPAPKATTASPTHSGP